jgi:hypothetical protein
LAYTRRTKRGTNPEAASQCTLEISTSSVAAWIYCSRLPPSLLDLPRFYCKKAPYNDPYSFHVAWDLELAPELVLAPALAAALAAALASALV